MAAPRLVPANPEKLGGRRGVRLLHHLDAPALEQGGESGVRFGPRDADLELPVLGALHAGHGGMQEGVEGTTVEVAPDPLLGVVEEGERLAGLRARPTLPH